MSTASRRGTLLRWADGPALVGSKRPDRVQATTTSTPATRAASACSRCRSQGFAVTGVTECLRRFTLVRPVKGVFARPASGVRGCILPRRCAADVRARRVRVATSHRCLACCAASGAEDKLGSGCVCAFVPRHFIQSFRGYARRAGPCAAAKGKDGLPLLQVCMLMMLPIRMSHSSPELLLSCDPASSPSGLSAARHSRSNRYGMRAVACASGVSQLS